MASCLRLVDGQLDPHDVLRNVGARTLPRSHDNFKTTPDRSIVCDERVHQRPNRVGHLPAARRLHSRTIFSISPNDLRRSSRYIRGIGIGLDPDPALSSVMVWFETCGAISQELS